MSRIAVIVPSRLAVNPASPRGALYLERAIGSIRRQSVAKDHEIDVYVGLDHGIDAPTGMHCTSGVGVWFAWPAPTATRGQASVVNAAANLALDDGYDLLAFLEDDDVWNPQKLEYQLIALSQGYEFVSCSQREVTPDGDYVRVCDFAGPSSWLMPAQTWRDVGPMDESFKWHLDTQWIGRLNKLGKKRLHFAEHAGDVSGRPWLANVGRHSKLAMTTGLLEPLVTRTSNPAGGMARIATDPVAAAESQREHMRMWEMNGASVPW